MAEKGGLAAGPTLGLLMEIGSATTVGYEDVRFFCARSESLKVNLKARLSSWVMRGSVGFLTVMKTAGMIRTAMMGAFSNLVAFALDGEMSRSRWRSKLERTTRSLC